MAVLSKVSWTLWRTFPIQCNLTIYLFLNYIGQLWATYNIMKSLKVFKKQLKLDEKNGRLTTKLMGSLGVRAFSTLSVTTNVPGPSQGPKPRRRTWFLDFSGSQEYGDTSQSLMGEYSIPEGRGHSRKLWLKFNSKNGCY